MSSLEKENIELEADGRRLKKKLDALKNMAFQLEAMEKENSQLEQENLELRRSAESLRSAGSKAAQLEAEIRELESERIQLKRNLELLKASSKKTERLEVRFENCQSYEWSDKLLLVMVFSQHQCKFHVSSERPFVFLHLHFGNLFTSNEYFYR